MPNATRGLRQTAGGLLKRREILVTAGVLLAVLAWTAPVPPGILVLGLVAGASLALQAIGIGLVYRSNRIINFAQVAMGAMAGTLFTQLVERRTFVAAVRRVCPPCVRPPSGSDSMSEQELNQLVEASPTLSRVVDPADDLDVQVETVLDALAITDAATWMVYANYLLAALISIALAVAVVWAFYVLVIKRFNSAPRLVLTVVTIAAGFAIESISGFIIGRFFSGEAYIRYSEGARPPVDWQVGVGQVRIGPDHMLTIAAVVIAAAALTVFLRRSAVGVALRGAAENPQRAETLGIPVATVTGRAWVLAALLASVASVLAAAGTGDGGSMQSSDFLVRTLVAAAVGGLVSLPAIAFGAFSIGLMDQAFIWDQRTNSAMAVILFGLLVAVLLVQRARATRADIDAEGTWEATREIRPIPPELRQVKTVRRWLAIGGGALALWLVAFPWVMSPSQTNLGTSTVVLAIIGLSLLVLTGWSGQISLSQMGFAAVGGWIALVLDWPFLLSLVAAGVMGALCAVAVGIPALRLRGLHLAITTLSFGLMITTVLLDRRYLGSRLPNTVTRPVFLGLDLEDDRVFYYLTLVALALAVTATAGLRRSRTARTLIATKDNEPAAQTFGISLMRVRLNAFAVSGFMAGIAGALLAFTQHGLEPASFSPRRSMDLFLITLIGGLGAIAGPVLGAFYRGGIQMLSGSALGAYLNLFLDPGIGVILVFLVIPGGLTQAIVMVRDSWLRRIASRLRLIVPSLIADRRGEPGERLPMSPKVWPSSNRPMFVPERYRLKSQWAHEARKKELDRA